MLDWFLFKDVKHLSWSWKIQKCIVRLWILSAIKQIQSFRSWVEFKAINADTQIQQKQRHIHLKAMDINKFTLGYLKIQTNIVSHKTYSSSNGLDVYVTDFSWLIFIKKFLKLMELWRTLAKHHSHWKLMELWRIQAKHQSHWKLMELWRILAKHQSHYKDLEPTGEQNKNK